MKFTMSKDGLRRTTLRIQFRIGLDYLETAGVSLLWKELVESSLAEHHTDERAAFLKEHARALTRPRVTAELREMLQANGYGSTDAISDDLYWQECVPFAAARIGELWPRLAEEWKTDAT